MVASVFPLVEVPYLVEAISIPLLTGVIGYVTNWSGVWMLFNPIRFRGFRVPGLRPFVEFLPRKVQEIPGVMHGGVGWQGIVPSRAGKMGSIAVDKGIAKLGNLSEFYSRLEPEKIAEHILATSQRDLHDLVERIMRRENPRLWNDLPPQVRAAVHARVERQLPDIVREVTDQIGKNIDQLVDVKLMVIRRLEEEPELANKVFQEIGRRELVFIQNFGFYFGFAAGVPLIGLLEVAHYWWVLPIAGIVIGYVTNLLGIAMIFQPVEPRKIGPFTFHGLFMRRQDEAAEIYSKIIADDIVTIGNIGNELMHGPRGDRTRRMIEDSMRPAVDRATGPARAAVRVAVGAPEYDRIREGVAVEAVEYAITPMSDPEFNVRQSAAVRRLIGERMRVMPPKDFAEMLRSALEQDEWLLYLHGAVLGFGAGIVHLAIFGTF